MNKNIANTTLCYIKRDNKYLMLHRCKKENDLNAGKWIGVGGKFEKGESPEECLKREVLEETGLILTSYRLHGIVTFDSETDTEYMFLYTADGFDGEPGSCSEGELVWISIEDVPELNLWEGDRKFLPLLEGNSGFFSMKLSYCGDELIGTELCFY